MWIDIFASASFQVASVSPPRGTLRTVGNVPLSIRLDLASAHNPTCALKIQPISLCVAASKYFANPIGEDFPVRGFVGNIYSWDDAPSDEIEAVSTH